MTHANVTVTSVSSSEDLEHLRVLFREYAASLHFDLAFQGFDRELAELPGRYAPPSGCALLARVDAVIAGCVALRAIGDGVCEMKRLFVRPDHQRLGIGRLLATSIIEAGRAAGYTTMKLDTVPAMSSAIELYTSLGFRDTEPYTTNPVEGTRFLARRLDTSPAAAAPTSTRLRR